jgi:hypothetical protein
MNEEAADFFKDFFASATSCCGFSLKCFELGRNLFIDFAVKVISNFAYLGFYLLYSIATLL